MREIQRLQLDTMKDIVLAPRDLCAYNAKAPVAMR